MLKKERVRAELVKAAREAFASHGYAKTTIADIASVAGKGKSTLYYYFENKTAIFSEVIDLEGTKLKNILLGIVHDPNRTALEKIKDYITIRWYEFEKLGNLYKTMRREFLENYDFVQKYRRQYDELEVQLISTILIQGVRNKEFSIAAENVEMVALTIVLSMKALEIPFLPKINMLLSSLN